MPRYDITVLISRRYEFRAPNDAIEAATEEEAREQAMDRAMQLYLAQNNPLPQHNAMQPPDLEPSITRCEQVPEQQV